MDRLIGIDIVAKIPNYEFLQTSFLESPFHTTNNMPRTTSFPKIEQVIMMTNDCGKAGDQHRSNRIYGASSSPSSLCHVLFPSRCPPHLFSERIIKAVPRPTLHRHSRYVFASSITRHVNPLRPRCVPSKKSTHARKHHRRRNFALNAMEFDTILRESMANAQK